MMLTRSGSKGGSSILSFPHDIRFVDKQHFAKSACDYRCFCQKDKISSYFTSVFQRTKPFRPSIKYNESVVRGRKRGLDFDPRGRHCKGFTSILEKEGAVWGCHLRMLP